MPGPPVAPEHGPDPAVYDAAVRDLFARRPEHMHPGLERITALCAALGDPQRAAPLVHLTGTNGKTSLARMITALLGAHGLTVGTYTSPHLQDVRERIRIDGLPISRQALLDALTALAAPIAAVEAARGELVTFFETLTALAYARFAQEDVDAAVVEVGMGGRWDATNVAAARVAVINPIALDHAELGRTVTAVAGEKAGIIEPGAPCVLAAQDEAAARVVRAHARALEAPLLLAGRDFAVESCAPDRSGQLLTLRSPRARVPDVRLALHGQHQAANAAVALTAADALLADLAIVVDPEAVQRGFAAVASPGRFELVADATRTGPVVLDGAHNPAGAAALADTLRAELAGRRRVLVVGAMGDKDCEGILDALLPVVDEVVATAAPTSRAAPAARIAKLCRLAGRNAEVCEDVGAALERAGAAAGDDGAVVVTGSLHLVGAARDALGLPVL